MIEASSFEKPQNIVIHPWRRFFARSLDLGLYSVLVMTIGYYVFKISFSNDPLSNVLDTFFACLIMLVMAPRMLSTLGTSPGKWIFGLVVRDKSGDKLSFLGGFRRIFGVFSRGLGFSIPLYNLYRQYTSYKTCQAGQALSWDEGLSYRIKDTNGFRFIGLFGGWVLIIVIIFMLVFRSALPINRGPISSEEYIENYNYFTRYYNLDTQRRLLSDGTWSKDRAYNDNTIVFTYGSTKLPNHEFVEKDGKIKKIVLHLEEDNGEFIGSLNTYLLMAYSAFVGAEKSLDLKALYHDSVAENLDNCFQNYEFEIAGIRVKNQVDMVGYTNHGHYLMPDSKGQETPYFSLTFTMEKIQ
jgi:uncharacterized RDD family membrane protein YckC